MRAPRPGRVSSTTSSPEGTAPVSRPRHHSEATARQHMNTVIVPPTKGFLRFCVVAFVAVPGCSDVTGLSDAVPVVASISPSTIPVGSAATVVAVTGTGFSRQTRVRLDGADRSSTWQADTLLVVLLHATDFLNAGTRALTASSPSGRSSSAPVQLVVTSPAPAIDSVAPGILAAGHPSTTVTVFGAGFRPGVVVRWDGADRPTVRESGSRLSVSVNWSDLVVADTHIISVHHGMPAPDSSMSREFIVANRAPAILGTTPSQATAGRSAFTLILEGSDFMPGAVVVWNGTPRPTTFISAARLTVEVTAEDVAFPDTVMVRVENPAPAIAASNELSFAVRPPGHHVLSLVIGDAAWDPVRGVLYASVRGTDATHPNRIIALDPLTGDVLRSVYAGSNPGRLALSDDMSVLHVALDGAASIRRIDLTTFTPDLEFRLATFEGRILYVDDMVPVPGRPGTVAVTHLSRGYIQGRGMGTGLYDNGVQRGPLLPGVDGGTTLAFASPDTLYGFDDWTTAHRLTRMIVSDTGLVIDATGDNLIPSFFADILYLKGFIFSSQGNVVDPLSWTAVADLGITAEAFGALASDASAERVFFMHENTLTAIDAATLATVGRVDVADVPAYGIPTYERGTFLRWGTDGFAYRTPDRLVIFRNSLAVQ